VKKLLSLGFLLTAVFAISLVGFAYNSDTFVLATTVGWDSFDPAWAYDTASGQALFHIYDQLVAYGDITTEIVPSLALEVPSLENGLLTVNEDGSGILRFNIREGVKFHNGADLDVDDVVYSLRRAILADPTAGPNWMLLYGLLGVYEINELIDSVGVDAAFDAVAAAIYADNGQVVLETVAYVPYLLQILAGPWCAILDEDSAIAAGAWNGEKAGWDAWHDLAKEDMAYYTTENGTGPFTLAGAPDSDLGYSLARFDGFWGDAPKLARVEVIYDDEWTNRRLMLEQGDADAAYIPTQYRDQVLGTPDIRTVYNLPSLNNGGLLLNMNIPTEGNDRLGSGQLDGAGIPPDFFQDEHVRKAFSMLFDYDRYRTEVLLGESVVPATAVPSALPYSFQERQVFYDPEAALAELKLAWDGEVWEKGFFLRLDYNTGNDNRKVACEMFKDELQKLDVRFNVEVRGIPWPQYLDDNRARRMTMFYIGWAPDYPDIDNYVFPYYHSQGAYGGRGSFGVLEMSDQMDSLIAQGGITLDPAAREAIYAEIQQLALDNSLAIMTDEATGRVWMRRWVADYVYNPTTSGGWNWRIAYKTADGSDGALYSGMSEVRHEIAEW
jgi:peptide/nickel transport system substrate-binding protein